MKYIRKVRKVATLLGIASLCVGLCGCQHNKTEVYKMKNTVTIDGSMIGAEKNLESDYVQKYKMIYEENKVSQVINEIEYTILDKDAKKEDLENFARLVGEDFNENYKTDGLEFDSELKDNQVFMSISIDLAKVDTDKFDLSEYGVFTQNMNVDKTYPKDKLIDYLESAGYEK